MQAKTERFEMRLDQGTLDGLDTWRASQKDVPSRAEAVRRLIELGLSTGSADQLRLSDGEKLMMLMLSEVYKHLKIKGGVDPDFIESVIYGGHHWALRWKYPGIFHGHEDSESAVSEVVHVLDMWQFLERGYDQLSEQDRRRVEKEAEPFGKDVKFRGFDGNNESELLGIARFLIDKLDRFAIFEGRELNSHMPSIETYKRMLDVFLSMRTNLMGADLNANQIIRILQARTHPSHR